MPVYGSVHRVVTARYLGCNTLLIQYRELELTNVCVHVDMFWEDVLGTSSIDREYCYRVARIGNIVVLAIRPIASFEGRYKVNRRLYY